MGRLWFGSVQHDLCCAGLALGRDALLSAILPDMDLLRLAPHRAAVKVDKHHFCDSLYLWHRAIYPFGYGLEFQTLPKVRSGRRVSRIISRAAGPI